MNTAKPGTDEFPSPSAFELEHFLPYRLSLLTNTISQGIARSYREKHDISIIEWRILAVLGRFPGLTASEVVGRTAMDKVAVSRAVKTLVQKKLLRRVNDPADRRRMNLHITSGPGTKVVHDVVPLALQFESRLLQALDSEEREAFGKAIEKLQARAAVLGT